MAGPSAAPKSEIYYNVWGYELCENHNEWNLELSKDSLHRVRLEHRNRSALLILELCGMVCQGTHAKGKYVRYRYNF